MYALVSVSLSIISIINSVASFTLMSRYLTDTAALRADKTFAGYDPMHPNLVV